MQRLGLPRRHVNPAVNDSHVDQLDSQAIGPAMKDLHSERNSRRDAYFLEGEDAS